MKRDTVVETGVRQINKIAGSDGHLVEEKLGLEIALRGLESGDRIRHDCNFC